MTSLFPVLYVLTRRASSSSSIYPTESSQMLRQAATGAMKPTSLLCPNTSAAWRLDRLSIAQGWECVGIVDGWRSTTAAAHPGSAILPWRPVLALVRRAVLPALPRRIQAQSSTSNIQQLHSSSWVPLRARMQSARHSGLHVSSYRRCAAALLVC